MDDLYQNAWSETPATAESSITLKGTASAWSPPKLSLASHDEEADLAAPSWSTGAGISWDEPSESAGFSWSQADPDLAWGTSTYENIQIRKPPEEREPSPPPPQLDDASNPPTSELHTTPTPDVDEISVEHDLSPPIRSDSPTFTPKAVPTPPDSPDAFGTFASGFAADDEPVSAFLQKDFEEDAWGSPWVNGDGEAHSSQDAESLDEWEAARQQKAKHDRRVPPELVASILAQCGEFIRETWPDPEVKESDADKETDGGATKDSSRDDWRRGLEGVDGLEASVNTMLPPLSLQPQVQFGKTAIARKMAASVRLTKNLSLTKGSPMSHYLAAKGSTAWEVAVKERKEEVEDDVVPVGWRILEKEQASAAAADANKAKPAGRLFSFWNRRASAIPQAASASPEANEDTASMTSVRSESPAPNANISHSRSGSQDSVKPQVPVITDRNTSTPTPSFTPPVAPQMSSYATAPDPVPERTPTPPAAAPSAVSRFLNRFSRRSSAPNSRSPRHSLALSSDDLEFLSDIVPSAGDDAEDAAEALRELDAMKPQPLPPILPPPPPPPAPVPASKATSPVGVATPPASNNTNSGGPSLDDDFDDFFSATTSNIVPQPLGPPSRSSAPAPQPTLISAPPKLSMQPPTLMAPVKPDTRSLSPSPLAFIGSAVDRPASQPPLLPPPPSSRPHTPVSPANSTGSSRPKLPSPITLPPPSGSPAGSRPTSATSSTSHARSVSPTSPASLRPLAELYPQVQQTATASASMAPFALPPPPAPKPQPRINPMVPYAYADIMTPDSAISPQQSTSLLSSFNSKRSLDEDEYSDFYSSPVATSRSSLTMAPLMPPQSSQARVHGAFAVGHHSRPSVPSRFSLPPLTAPPPPAKPVISQKPALPPPASAPSINAFDDDDEFSEFHSSAAPSPAEPPSTQSLYAPGLDNSFSFGSDSSFLTPSKTSGFDNPTPPWSPLRTPSPPRPPSKSPSSILPLNPPPQSTQQAGHVPQSTQQQQLSSIGSAGLKRNSSIQERRKAEHQHTISLMERAAARPGRWPAPPSPLPEAIPMPGAGAKPEIDLLGGDDLMQGGAFLTPAPSRMGNAPPLAPAPTTQSAPSMDLFGPPLAASRPNSVGPPVISPPSSAPVKGSGLSAQDLSFFEGL